MSTMTILPATPDRFDEVQHALTGGGDGASCQCQWWTLTNAEWNATSAEQRGELFREEIDAGPPPGLIAYVDDVPAGFIRIGPRISQARLARTKLITSGSPEPMDSPDVWAATCFVVRREFRGQELTHELLDAAITFAKENGARVIEGYPVDTTAAKAKTNDLYVGTLSTFEEAGFRIDNRPKPNRAIVSLTF